MKYFFSFCLSMILTLAAFCQSDSVSIKNNNLYGTLGTIGICGSASINYEYLLLNNQNIKLLPKLTLGGLACGDFDGGGEESLFASASLSLLIGKDRINQGKKSYFFEFNAGLLAMDIDDTDIDDYQYSFIGLRTYNSKGLIMRFGFGLPELVQFSIGKNS